MLDSQVTYAATPFLVDVTYVELRWYIVTSELHQQGPKANDYFVFTYAMHHMVIRDIVGCSQL